MKLKFIGFQEGVDGEKFPLWNIKDSPRPDLHPDNSTVSMESIKEMIKS